MRKSTIIGAAIVALLVSFAAFIAMHGNDSTSASGVKRHISSSEVRLSNIETFEAQFRQDIPLGTPRRAVESYLVRQSVPHFFTEQGSGLGENTFYGTLRNIGTRWGFPASLAIRIHLNGNERVDKIWFRIDYDAS